MEMDDVNRNHIGWCTAAEYNRRHCRKNATTVIDFKYTYWKKCPYDHKIWVDVKEAEIAADVYEQYRLAEAAGADTYDEHHLFNFAQWVWDQFEVDAASQTNPDPEAAFFDTYDDRSPYDKFDENLITAYNDFHEGVDSGGR